MAVTAKRITALVNGFMLQSLFLFLMTLTAAVTSKENELYIIALLVLVLKVVLIPYFLKWIARKIKIEEGLGLYINPILSLLIVIVLSYGAYMFSRNIMGIQNRVETASFAISLSVLLTGLFIMVFRMKALAQVTGLLIMENGLFLAAVELCGNMPFFVEIAIFFDVFVFAVIIGIFVFRINELFAHIDVDKLTTLKG